MKKIREISKDINWEKGFTLIELMVVLVITGVVMTGIYATYNSQQEAYVTQLQVANAQQNGRAAMYMMEREIRMAGFVGDDTNPASRDQDNGTFTFNGRVSFATGSGSDGPDYTIYDVGFYDTDGNADTGGFNANDMNAFNSVLFSYNIDGDPTTFTASEVLSYSVYDYPVGNPDGRMDLARSNGAGRQLLAEGIEAVAFAFAFDDDTNDELDLDAGGSVIWAIDSDNSGGLDWNLDANSDGIIDINDSAGGTVGPIGVALAAAEIPLNRIRAVRVWILASTHIPIKGYTDSQVYVVGNKIVVPGAAGMPDRRLKRRILETTVKCRNLGLRRYGS